MQKVIGYDPYGFTSREMCIYYSWKFIYGVKLAVILAYSFSRSYHDFLKSCCKQLFPKQVSSLTLMKIIWHSEPTSVTVYSLRVFRALLAQNVYAYYHTIC